MQPQDCFEIRWTAQPARCQDAKSLTQMNERPRSSSAMGFHTGIQSCSSCSAWTSTGSTAALRYLCTPKDTC